MDSDDVKVVVVGIVVGIVLFIGGLVGLINWGQKVSCQNAYANYQPQYSFFTGCRIMWKGVLTPTDIVRTID